MTDPQIDWPGIGPAKIEKDGATILSEVISRALATAYQRAIDDPALPEERSQTWANLMSGHWICSLRNAFQHQYAAVAADRRQVVVFGGKMGVEGSDPGMAEFGIRGWRRREFMYDACVLRMARVDAAFSTIPGAPAEPRQVAVIKHAIWLVESEMAKNGTAVAEDISKLHIGRSDHSLLIAANGTRDDARWLSFIGRAMAGIGGEAFIALMPTYASADPCSARWISKTVEVDLYRCLGAEPRHFATVTAATCVTVPGSE